MQTDEALRAALADESWQVALVDYNIPGFSGIEALRLIAELAPDLPAITVSGSIDEDTAVATMAAGAMDYVLKDNLTRLAPAVRRAIDGADLRRAHRRGGGVGAPRALRRRPRLALHQHHGAPTGPWSYANDLACRSLGWRARRARRRASSGSSTRPCGPRRTQALWAEAVEHGVAEFRIDAPRSDGSRIDPRHDRRTTSRAPTS